MPFHVTMLLADAAQAVDNKLYVIGGGWSVLRAQVPTALALLIKVPWDQANAGHTMRLDLVDSDGQPIEIAGPVGDQPVVIENEFEVGRPPGMVPGTSIDLALALNFGPLPLGDGRYEWRLTIDDESREDWRLPFQVALPAPPQAT
jgi:hypothetical protein